MNIRIQSIKAGLKVALAALIGSLVALSPEPARAQADQTGLWTTLTRLPFFPVHNHLLPTGKVLMWPGDGGISGNDPHLWDPVTQGLTPLVNKPGHDTFCSGHSFLADGRLLVAGGHIQNSVGLAFATLYDPSTGVWTRTTRDMNAGRWYPTVTTLANGDALVVSGQVDNSVGVNTSPQVYQASTGTWRTLSALSQDLYPMMFLAPNGRVFNVAPTSTTRSLDTSGTGAWSFVANRNHGDRNYGSAVMYADGKVLVVGGGDPPTNSAEVIDLNQASPTWTSVAPMRFARRQLNATALPDGTVLVTGGTSGAGFNNGSAAVLPAELWNPATNTWTTLASATVPRLYHSAAVLLPDGRVLTTGGNDQFTPEAFSPPYLSKGARPVLNGVPSTIAYGQSFSVQSDQAANIVKVTLIRVASVTHGFDANQRLNNLAFSAGAGAVNVVAPANGNIAPPGHYLLFLVSSAGVPSVGSVVQLGAAAAPPPAPAASLSSLSPNTRVAGSPCFTMTVNGSGFITGATVRWNGANRTTTFVSNTQLTAAIPSSDVAAQGTAQVTAVNEGAAPSNALTFTVKAAAPSPARFDLTVTKTGSDPSKGTVASSPAGINCGTTCTSGFASGTAVTLTASVTSNRTFAGWGGACTGTGTCTVTMNAAKSVTATFNRR